MIDVSKMPKLGFGLMRMPKMADEEVDIEQVKEMVDSYMKAGFNYFDTAYVYHGGKSEVVVKEAIVKRYPRNSFTLATKLPAWCMTSADDRDKIFNEQLERCGVDYFDFYLLHSAEDGKNYDTYEKFDCFSWGLQKKAEGKIKHFGFSYHGSPELLEKILDKHPETEFVQIQLNYTDWNNQIVQSGKLYEIVKARNIPIIIMEPVKGGMLANMDSEIETMLKNARPNDSVASWAMRFAGSLDGVATILSGMSNREQMQDNIKTFANFEPLSESEKKLIGDVVKKLQATELIGCTACRYCCDGCPKKIDIPEIFKCVNMKRLYPNDGRPNGYYKRITTEYKHGRASDCIACGQCEGVCPQHLPIVELLKEAAKNFDVA